jgi:hypothetical protein
MRCAYDILEEVRPALAAVASWRPCSAQKFAFAMMIITAPIVPERARAS